MRSFLFLVLIYALYANCRPLRETSENQGSEYNDDLFEGDIAGVPVEGVLQSRNGISNNNYLWKYRIVYYRIDDAFNDEEQLKIDEAVTEYHRKTCMRLYRLIVRNDEMPPSWIEDYLHITRENSGCWSYVGRLGRGQQQLNLQSPGCMSRGTILHEIMHAIGFWHEQSRADRDNYVTINETNVQQGKMNNFFLRYYNESTTLDTPYDVESVMHYGAYAFAANTNYRTIIPKQPGVELGQRLDFSKIDITKINRMYGCT